ncbi:transcriptional regulator [Pararhizobium mangrovi]|uniref:Transcriptional regulator n=1 Tax=Pararhizobium mangrovi TaxID=2590452 RepID=A0A506U523_9HYPH|nr:transcriptional regulator [Pararhizobium mangrovi]TPW27017.1 transcriptional regulator [Pararhizobium mangrovi]
MRKLERARLFQRRLSEAMARAALSKSALARQIGADRSTISLLVSSDDARLPNAHFAAECAAALNVSSDWLLGLTDRPERSAEIVSATMEMTEAARTPSDEQIFLWHQEASGYKIRHVPATMPDLLKSEAVLQFEYSQYVGRTSEQAITDMRDKLDYLRAPETDYEIAVPADVLENFAAGQGYWAGLPREVRRDQLARLSNICSELYPSLRLYLFDRKMLYSAPLTIFGPLIASIYVGEIHMVFRQRRQILALTKHFDGLVRGAVTDARHMPERIERLLAEI